MTSNESAIRMLNAVTLANVTPRVGSRITTSASGVSGIVLECVANRDARSLRIRLRADDGSERWTTKTITDLIERR